MLRAARVDRNQAEIVTALRSAGCSVAITSVVGDGFPDLAVGKTFHTGVKRTWLMEVKDGKKPPSARELTPAQVEWHINWRGQVAVVSSVEEALALVSEDS